MKLYTWRQTALANLPYALMVLLGAAVLLFSLGLSALSIAVAVAFLAYGVMGALWIMVFVCPYCGYYGTRGCPCGYGIPSARLVKKGSHDCFAEKFKRHIPVIVPLWLIPAAVGGIALGLHFSWERLILLAAFAVDAFAILPLVSRGHACADCPQKEGCPWMSSKTGGAQPQHPPR